MTTGVYIFKDESLLLSVIGRHISIISSVMHDEFTIDKVEAVGLCFIRMRD